MARPGRSRAGLAVQLRFAPALSSETYVSDRGWEKATLVACPLHGAAGCRFARHTPYERKSPPGTMIARYYCRDGHQTFSLLPDWLATRLPGSLEAVEAANVAVEEGPTWEAAAERVRPDIEPAGGLRWLRRRVIAVRAGLRAVAGLFPDLFAGCPTTVTGFRARIGAPAVLIELREIAADCLGGLPPPLGFGPRPARRRARVTGNQQDPGPDPPEARR